MKAFKCVLVVGLFLFIKCEENASTQADMIRTDEPKNMATEVPTTTFISLGAIDTSTTETSPTLSDVTSREDKITTQQMMETTEVPTTIMHGDDYPTTVNVGTKVSNMMTREDTSPSSMELTTPQSQSHSTNQSDFSAKLTTETSLSKATTQLSNETNEVDVTTQLTNETNELDVTTQLINETHELDVTTQVINETNELDVTTEITNEKNHLDVTTQLISETTELTNQTNESDITTQQPASTQTTTFDADDNTTQPITTTPLITEVVQETTQTSTDVVQETTQTSTEVVQETTQISTDVDKRRPLYIVGHMTNSLEEVKYMLDRGANALEFDLNFDSSGTPTHVFHGYLCDLGRICDRYEKFDLYMEALANMTTPSNIRYRKRLVLLYIDLKLHNLDTRHMEYAGENLAVKIVHHLGWRKNVKPKEKSVVNVLFSIEYPSFHPVFFGLKRELRRLLSDDLYYKHIGWSFDGDGFSESTAASVWKAVGIDRNIWRGYGAPNMFAFLVGDGILDDAICNREQTNVPSKVVRWTIDNPIDIRTLLRKSVDVIVTNFPQVTRFILKEVEFSSKYRVATIEDSPWEKYIDPNDVSKLCKKGSIFKLFDELFDL